MAGFWINQPPGRVIRLDGASPDAIVLALEPLPGDAPAIVTYHPDAISTPGAATAALLDELDKVAIGLFPAWLPGAEWIRGRAGHEVAAVRSLAMRAAAESFGFGPFIADLAERSLHEGARSDRFPYEVRAAGLARVIAASFERPEVALLVVVPSELSPAAEEALVATCERVASHARLGVWLTGAQLRTIDRVPTVRIELAARDPDERAAPVPAAPQSRTSYPALAGRPHPASPAEHALEAALARRPWAVGRAWNQMFQVGPLVNPVRLDLLWAAERCVVEVDGPEHCNVLRYESDRRRDVDLQLAGFAVLRFTNFQIERELSGVLSRIERFLLSRRALVQKGNADGERPAYDDRGRDALRVDG